VHAVDLDLRVVGGGGAAQDQDVLTAAEDEEIAEAPFQALGLERDGDRGCEEDTRKAHAHGGSCGGLVPSKVAAGGAADNG